MKSTSLKGMAERIREEVTMEQVLALYGYVPRRGYILCPFHGDRNPSLKIYPGNKGWYCFGCGRGGSAIDFVMAHENCSFRLAVAAIANALGLGPAVPAGNPEDGVRQQTLRREADAFAGTFLKHCDALLRELEDVQYLNCRKTRELEARRAENAASLTADEYTFLLCRPDRDEDLEIRKAMIEDLKKEVSAWRKSAAKAPSP